MITYLLTYYGTWATSVPILVFLGLSVLDLGQTYATDRRQTSGAHHRLIPPALGGGIKINAKHGRPVPPPAVDVNFVTLLNS